MKVLWFYTLVCLVLVDFAGALSTEAFANTPCVANVGETKDIHAADWGLDTCYMDLPNVTRTGFLKSLFKYSVNSSVEQLSLGINDGRPLSITSHVPLTRATCVAHDLFNTTLPMRVIYGFSSYVECSNIACRESQICDLDDDLNVLQSNEEQSCLTMCAEQYLRCISLNLQHGTAYAIFGAAVGENRLLGYTKPFLFAVDSTRVVPENAISQHIKFAPHGIIQNHELALGIVFSSLTVLLFFIVVKFDLIDILLRLIYEGFSKGIKYLKGRSEGDTLVLGDVVKVWSTTKKQWQKAIIESHVKKLKLQYKRGKSERVQWIDANATNANDNQPIISSHDMNEWKAIKVGDKIKARPKGVWMPCTVKEIKEFIDVKFLKTNSTQKFLLPNMRVKTVKKRVSRANRMMEQMSEKFTSFKSNQTKTESSIRKYEAQSNTAKNDMKPIKYMANSSLFFFGLVIFRILSSILRILKLIFNIFLLLQMVAIDHYTLTAYSYSINISILGAFNFLRVPSLGIYIRGLFDFIYFPIELMFPSFTNLCPGSVLSCSLFVMFVLCILLYVFEQGNLLFLTSSALQSIKHGHGHFVGVLVDRFTNLSTSFVLYMLIIFMSSVSNVIYFVVQSMSMHNHTCGTGDTIIFVSSYLFFSVMAPFILILFLRAFSENKDEDYKVSTVEKVFFTRERKNVFQCSRCKHGSSAVSPSKNDVLKSKEKYSQNVHKNFIKRCKKILTKGLNSVMSLIVSHAETLFAEVIVLLKVTFGIWDQSVLDHYNVIGKAIEFNSDSHDSVLTLTAKASTLFWLTFSTPLVILSKIGEVASDPPINWIKHKRLLFEETAFNRLKQWVINISTLTLTVISVVVRKCSIYVILILWVIFFEMLELVPDIIDFYKNRKNIIQSLSDDSLKKESNHDDGDLEGLAARRQRGY